MASCADAEGARDEAAAIVLLAKARMGELTREIPKVPHGGAGGGSKVPERNSRNQAAPQSKSEVLSHQGVSRKEAAECEKIADLKASGDLEKMIASGT